MRIRIQELFRIANPDADPDKRIQICNPMSLFLVFRTQDTLVCARRSMPLINGSGSGFGYNTMTKFIRIREVKKPVDTVGPEHWYFYLNFFLHGKIYTCKFKEKTCYVSNFIK